MIDVSVSSTDLRGLMAAMERGRRELGKTLRGSIAWAGAKVAKSLSAGTRQSPKLRKVIRNPHPDARRDGRRAKFGVEKYDRNGVKYFAPIGRTGEFGKIRFVAKRTGEYLSRDRVTGKVARVRFETSADTVPGIMQSRKRVIGRSGLAKKSWKLARSRMNTGGTGRVMDVEAPVRVSWRGRDDYAVLRIENDLRYATKALRGGEAGVGLAIEAAARGMMGLIDRRIKEKLEAK
jgi:hypothetical protein